MAESQSEVKQKLNSTAEKPNNPYVVRRASTANKKIPFLLAQDKKKSSPDVLRSNSVTDKDSPIIQDDLTQMDNNAASINLQGSENFNDRDQNNSFLSEKQDYQAQNAENKLLNAASSVKKQYLHNINEITERAEENGHQNEVYSKQTIQAGTVSNGHHKSEEEPVLTMSEKKKLLEQKLTFNGSQKVKESTSGESTIESSKHIEISMAPSFGVPIRFGAPLPSLKAEGHKLDTSLNNMIMSKPIQKHKQKPSYLANFDSSDDENNQVNHSQPINTQGNAISSTTHDKLMDSLVQQELFLLSEKIHQDTKANARPQEIKKVHVTTDTSQLSQNMLHSLVQEELLLLTNKIEEDVKPKTHYHGLRKPSNEEKPNWQNELVQDELFLLQEKIFESFYAPAFQNESKNTSAILPSNLEYQKEKSSDDQYNKKQNEVVQDELYLLQEKICRAFSVLETNSTTKTFHTTQQYGQKDFLSSHQSQNTVHVSNQDEITLDAQKNMVQDELFMLGDKICRDLSTKVETKSVFSDIQKNSKQFNNNNSHETESQANLVQNELYMLQEKICKDMSVMTVQQKEASYIGSFSQINNIAASTNEPATFRADSKAIKPSDNPSNLTRAQQSSTDSLDDINGPSEVPKNKKESSNNNSMNNTLQLTQNINGLDLSFSQDNKDKELDVNGENQVDDNSNLIQGRDLPLDIFGSLGKNSIISEEVSPDFALNQKYESKLDDSTIPGLTLTNSGFSIPSIKRSLKTKLPSAAFISINSQKSLDTSSISRISPARSRDGSPTKRDEYYEKAVKEHENKKQERLNLIRLEIAKKEQDAIEATRFSHKSNSPAARKKKALLPFMQRMEMYQREHDKAMAVLKQEVEKERTEKAGGEPTFRPNLNRSKSKQNTSVLITRSPQEREKSSLYNSPDVSIIKATGHDRSDSRSRYYNNNRSRSGIKPINPQDIPERCGYIAERVHELSRNAQYNKSPVPTRKTSPKYTSISNSAGSYKAIHRQKKSLKRETEADKSTLGYRLTHNIHPDRQQYDSIVCASNINESIVSMLSELKARSNVKEDLARSMRWK